jgi:hypothetical protein
MAHSSYPLSPISIERTWILPTVQLLSDIYAYYAQFSAWRLRNMIHEESPARRRDAEAAIDRARAADAALRTTLLEATNGNFTPGPGLDDASPIRAVMQLVDLDTILTAIQARRHDHAILVGCFDLDAAGELQR